MSNLSNEEGNLCFEIRKNIQRLNHARDTMKSNSNIRTNMTLDIKWIAVRSVHYCGNRIVCSEGLDRY